MGAVTIGEAAGEARLRPSGALKFVAESSIRVRERETSKASDPYHWMH